MAKLTETQIAEIREKYSSAKTTHRALAEEYGVSYTTINRILNSDYADRERARNRERNKRNKDAYNMNSKYYTFCFNTEKDADVIDKLDSVENRQGYIKELVRRDIEEN